MSSHLVLEDMGEVMLSVVDLCRVIIQWFSVEVPTFNKVEIPVFTMLVPGSIASIHS